MYKYVHLLKHRIHFDLPVYSKFHALFWKLLSQAPFLLGSLTDSAKREAQIGDGRNQIFPPFSVFYPTSPTMAISSSTHLPLERPGHAVAPSGGSQALALVTPFPPAKPRSGACCWLPLISAFHHYPLITSDPLFSIKFLH